jgi:hypothetical protein
MRVWVVTCGQWTREAIAVGSTKDAAIRSAKAVLDAEAAKAGDKPWSLSEVEERNHIVALEMGA